MVKKRCVLWSMLVSSLLIGIVPVSAMDLHQEEPLPDEARKAYEQSQKELQERSQASREWAGKIKTNFIFETRFFQVDYTESSTRTDLVGNYKTNAVRGDLGLEAYFQSQEEDSYGLELSYGMMLPASAKEKWTLDDLEQKNDVDLKSNEFKIGVGWKHWFNPKLGLGQSLYYGLRQFRQTGNDSGEITDSSSGTDFPSVEQTITVNYVAYKPKLIWKPWDKIETQLGVVGGYIWFAKVSNEAIDADDNNISGHSIYGSLMGVEGKITYFILDEFSIYIGGFWERQRLDGYYKAGRQGSDVEHSEVRENTMETKGLLAGVDFRF